MKRLRNPESAYLNPMEICCIEELLNYAFDQSIIYRFDPLARRIHEQYLDVLKDMKKQIDTKE